MSSWQDMVALGCVLAAALWICRSAWRRIRRRGATHCGGEWTCPHPKPPSLVQIEPRRRK